MKHMKQWLAAVLSILMLLSCAACGDCDGNAPVVWDWSADALAEAIMTLLRSFGL